MPVNVIVKKVLSVQLAVLLLFAGISIRYSAHLCGGNLVATGLSLKDEVASCGMEEKSQTVPGIYHLRNHCCDILTATIILRTNFIPSSIFAVETVSFPDSFNFIPFHLTAAQDAFISQVYNDAWPPGHDFSNLYSSRTIRILRI